MAVRKRDTPEKPPQMRSQAGWDLKASQRPVSRTSLPDEGTVCVPGPPAAAWLWMALPHSPSAHRRDSPSVCERRDILPEVMPTSSSRHGRRAPSTLLLCSSCYRWSHFRVSDSWVAVEALGCGVPILPVTLRLPTHPDLGFLVCKVGVTVTYPPPTLVVKIT